MKTPGLCLLLLFLLLPAQTFGGEKRALLIAISDYSTQSGWNRTNAVNDISIILPGLEIQGFPSRNTIKLFNLQATKKGILDAFEKLTEKTRPGDIIYLHLAGHGHQVADTNGDEIDGLDEAFVTYNAEYLIDDELNDLILNLRRKAGKTGDVLIVVDTCHSGSMLGKTLPGDIIFGDEKAAQPDSIFRFIDSQKAKKVEEERSIYVDAYQDVASADELSPYLLISACTAQERNMEYFDPASADEKKYGPLSFALSLLLQEDISHLSYLSFFESLKRKMASLGHYYRLFQTPQMEGNAQRKVFSGEAIPMPAHFTINKLTPKTKSAVINAGKLAGIYAGTQISFYPPDTHDFRQVKPLRTGTVTQAGMVESVVSLASTAGGLNDQSWAVVSKYAFPKNRGENFRAKFIREARSASSDIALEIHLIDGNNRLYNIDTQMRNGNVEFHHGDYIDVRVRNKGAVPLYFQLMKISAFNEIKLLPIGRNKKDDCYVGAHDTSLSLRFMVSGNPFPFLETLIVVASPKVLDLSVIETQLPTLSEAPLTDYESFLDELFRDESTASGYLFQDVSIDMKSYYIR